MAVEERAVVAMVVEREAVVKVAAREAVVKVVAVRVVARAVTAMKAGGVPVERLYVVSVHVLMGDE